MAWKGSSDWKLSAFIILHTKDISEGHTGVMNELFNVLKGKPCFNLTHAAEYWSLTYSYTWRFSQTHITIYGFFWEVRKSQKFHVIIYLYFTAEHNRGYLKNVDNQKPLVPIDICCIDKTNLNQWGSRVFGYQHLSKYLLLSYVVRWQ